MAILDKKLELMDAQVITGNENATTTSDYYIDLGTVSDEWGASKALTPNETGGLWLNCRIGTTCTPATVAFTVNVYSHSTTTPSSGTAFISKAWTAAKGIAAGQTIIRQQLPAGELARYIGATVVSGATTITAGALDMWISKDSESEYPIT